MSEDKIVETIIEHDQALKSVAKAIDTLTDEAKLTNHKLDSIVSALAKQEVILERISHIEAKTKDSFSRVHSKIEEVKDIQNIGCTPLQLALQGKEGLDNRLRKVEGSINWIARVIIGSLLTGLIATLFIFARQT